MTDEQHLRMHFVSKLLDQGVPAEEAVEEAAMLTDFVLTGETEADEDELPDLPEGVIRVILLGGPTT